MKNAIGKNGVILILTLALLDQLSKFLVLSYLPLYKQEAVIEGFFNLYHTTNRGSIWGFFSGRPGPLVPTVMLVLSTTAFVIIIVLLLHSKPRGLERNAFLVILGGALGNIIDRLRYGHVIDFLDFHIGPHHWPTFNLADSFIFIGVVLLAFTILRRDKCTRS